MTIFGNDSSGTRWRWRRRRQRIRYVQVKTTTQWVQCILDGRKATICLLINNTEGSSFWLVSYWCCSLSASLWCILASVHCPQQSLGSADVTASTYRLIGDAGATSNSIALFFPLFFYLIKLSATVKWTFLVSCVKICTAGERTARRARGRQGEDWPCVLHDPERPP